MMRQQSAIEFLSTYSFAIFALSLVLVTAVTISLSIGTVAPVYSACNIQPLITCQQSLLTYNSVGGYFNFLLIFRNNLGFLLQFPSANAINLTLTGVAGGANAVNFGGCSPTTAPQGTLVICTVKVPGTSQVKQGSNTYTQFRINYNLCTSAYNSLYGNYLPSCPSNTVYTVTGYSFQTLSPPYTNLYNLSISSLNGIVIINGESYLSGTNIYLTGGTYNLYAQPNVGYHFISWNGVGSLLPSNAVAHQNTTFTFTTSGNIIVIFN
jgi:hypothetical protein